MTTYTYDNIIYSLDNGSAIVTGTASASSTNITIPGSIIYESNSYTVISIGDSGFNGYTSLSTIILPSSVTSIGGSAFYGCTNLTSIDVSACTLASIGDLAFQGCTGLASITVTGDSTSGCSIGAYAFSGCNAMTSATFTNVTTIGGSAFSGCSGVSISLHSSVTIGTEEFLGLTALVSITLPSSIISIGLAAFYECTNLTSIDVSACTALASIGDNAFQGCTNLTSINLSACTALASIDHRIFYRCTDLTSITLPSSVTSIGYAAFEECTSLTSIILPSSVTSIGDSAFYLCTGLTSINVSACTALASIGPTAFQGCTNLASIDMSTCTALASIGYAAFYECTSLTSIILPSSVTSIGDSAFYLCTDLTSINVSACTALASIGGSAFGNCSNLSSIIIPSSVTSINDNTFQGCTSLTSIILPSSVTSIGGSAFSTCTSLSSINVSACTALASIGGSAFEICSNLSSIIIPSSVTSIGDSAFMQCTNLTSINLPSTLGSIGIQFFSNCTSLSSIILPPSITSIGDFAFSTCTSLSSINLPSTLGSIGASCFEACSLSSITIPASLTTFGNSAFNGCPITSIVLPNNSGYVMGNNLCAVSVVNVNDAFSQTDLFVSRTITETGGEPSGEPGEVTMLAYVFPFIQRVVTTSKSTLLSAFFAVERMNLDSQIITYTNPAGVQYAGPTYTHLGLIYTLNSGVVSVNAIQAFTGSSVVILPTVSIGGTIYPVTEIVANSFTGKTGITSVVFSGASNITTIGDQAFQNTGLSSISLPASVTTIGAQAFATNSLTSVTLTANTYTLGNDAFSSVATVVVNTTFTSVGLLNSTYFGNPLSIWVYGANVALNTANVTYTDKLATITAPTVGNSVPPVTNAANIVNYIDLVLNSSPGVVSASDIASSGTSTGDFVTYSIGGLNTSLALTEAAFTQAFSEISNAEVESETVDALLDDSDGGSIITVLPNADMSSTAHTPALAAALALAPVTVYSIPRLPVPYPLDRIDTIVGDGMGYMHFDIGDYQYFVDTNTGSGERYYYKLVRTGTDTVSVYWSGITYNSNLSSETLNGWTEEWVLKTNNVSSNAILAFHNNVSFAFEVGTFKWISGELTGAQISAGYALVINNATGTATITQTTNGVTTTVTNPMAELAILNAAGIQYVDLRGACLLEGTLVHTPRGPIKIESIREGDTVLNQHKEHVKVKTVARGSHTVQNAEGTFNMIYKVPRGRFGAKSDLYLTKGHRMLSKQGNLVLPEKLGFTPAPSNEFCDKNGAYTVYHLLVEDGENNHLVVNGGCIVESWK